MRPEPQLSTTSRWATAACLVSGFSGCSTRVSSAIDATVEFPAAIFSDVAGGTTDGDPDRIVPAPPCLADVDEFATGSWYSLSFSPTTGSSVLARFIADGQIHLGEAVARGQCIQFVEHGYGLVDAGTVSVTIATPSWTLGSGPGGYYVALRTTTPSDIGLPIHLEATGGVVAAHALDLRVPPYVLVSLNGDTTSPYLVQFASQPMRLAWQPTDTQVYFEIWSGSTNPRLMCIIDGRLGQFEIPAATLTALGATPANAIIETGGLCRNTVRAGGQTVYARITHGRRPVVVLLQP